MIEKYTNKGELIKKLFENEPQTPRQTVEVQNHNLNNICTLRFEKKSLFFYFKSGSLTVLLGKPNVGSDLFGLLISTSMLI